MHDLRGPIKQIGVAEVAKACGVSERAVYKWIDNGFLPKTEFFGKTNYAKTIQTLSKGKIKAEDLLAISQKKLLAA
ncbi:helix-turn-helix domain-containing protein [Proteus vulgaris]|uniref:helix-turn-helix domain-containing protein n=1 Tax=Proteus vulgaris TaxID=585 RepID=UPI0034DD520F